jgi:hypothetical protein
MRKPSSNAATPTCAKSASLKAAASQDKDLFHKPPVDAAAKAKAAASLPSLAVSETFEMK